MNVIGLHYGALLVDKLVLHEYASVRSSGVIFMSGVISSRPFSNNARADRKREATSSSGALSTYPQKSNSCLLQ